MYELFHVKMYDNSNDLNLLTKTNYRIIVNIFIFLYQLKFSVT